MSETRTPAAAEPTPHELGLAVVQAGRFVGMLIAVLSQTPSTAAMIEPMKKVAANFHETQPSFFTTALVEELALGTLVTTPPAGSA